MQNAKDVVMSYIHSLDNQDYGSVENFLSEDVRIIGPAGEGFGGPKGFVKMMRNFPGRYDIKRIFSDEDEICLLYDFITQDAKIYMSSWYRVNEGKIVFIRTIFDPGAFSPPQSEK